MMGVLSLPLYRTDSARYGCWIVGSEIAHLLTIRTSLLLCHRSHFSLAMAKIQTEVKLDFKDVLIRPKRSTLKSRSQVSLERTLHMKHSGRDLSCVPIIAANMDTVGTFAMAKALAAHKILTAVHKHYSLDEWKEFVAANAALIPYLAVSSGISDDDFTKLAAIIAACPDLANICLDVANGYSEHFVNFVRRVRAAYPKHTIIVRHPVATLSPAYNASKAAGSVTLQARIAHSNLLCVRMHLV